MVVVTVSGTASEVGKTGLMCALLLRLPGWAAIKVTRGHYRSCGRDPETCCVSHLLGDRARVFGNRSITGVRGKDTGRYWEAGAVDVRWVVAARGQEAEGLGRALDELSTRQGVLVEGNRIVESLTPRLAILVAHPEQHEVKSSARRILERIDLVYVPDDDIARTIVDPSSLVGATAGSRRWPVHGPADLDRLAVRIVCAPGRASGRARDHRHPNPEQGR